MKQRVRFLCGVREWSRSGTAWHVVALYDRWWHCMTDGGTVWHVVTLYGRWWHCMTGNGTA